ncbi:MAG: long-chain fatty acid--CoA ligase, partial [Flavobacteriaceae bacterium]|nr:long-chain fatty acid--CoA ligase [Flavobacteriaceae bacterium]
MQTVTRLFDIPYFQQANFPMEKSFVDKRKGEWIAISTDEYISKANALSRALISLGVKANDKIAVISMTNR